MMSASTDQRIPVGIDVSKNSLDLKYGTNQRARGAYLHTSNDTAGFACVLAWLQEHGIAPEQGHLCLEATGTYSDGVAQFCWSHGYRVSVINPSRLAAFRQSEGISSKTDRQDAWVLACYCAQKQPQSWQPKPVPVEQMQTIRARIQDLEQMRQQERNRLENQRLDAATGQEIKEHVQWIEQRIKDNKKRLGEQLEPQEQDTPADEQVRMQLKERCALLCSIPGIGELTAQRLCSELWNPQSFESSRSLVRYAGVQPQEWQSGTSVHGKSRMGRAGHPEVRTWLYMCAIVAGTHDEDFRQWNEQLKQRGKAGKVRIVAIMRKLLHIVWGVIRSGQPYDALLAWPTHHSLALPIDGG